MMIDKSDSELVHQADSEAETELLASALAKISEPGMTVGLDGPLGAGKTRLVRAWAESLGVNSGEISSPTFVLIQHYVGRDLLVSHADAYRLEGSEEFEVIGGPELWRLGDRLFLIEWAEKIADLLPDDVIRIGIESVSPTRRVFRVVASKGIIDRLKEALDDESKARARLQ